MKKNILKKIISGVAIAIAGLTVVGLISNLVKSNECEHENVVELPAVEATCVSTGLTAGEKCEDCDEVIIEQKVVSATGQCVDKNGDYLCDGCGKSLNPTAGYVEVSLADMDDPYVEIAGRWLRVYKPGEDEDRELYTMYGWDDNGTSDPNDDKKFIQPISIDTNGFYLNGTPIYIEGIEIIETETYFDIHFEIGAYKIYTAGDVFMFDTYILEGLTLDNNSFEGFYLLEPPAANN